MTLDEFTSTACPVRDEPIATLVAAERPFVQAWPSVAPSEILVADVSWNRRRDRGARGSYPVARENR